MTLVHQMLERTATRLPDKTALVCGERRLSYAALDRASNALAASLVGEGVRQGQRVMLFMDNSVEAVVAIFGVLKAGAAFTLVKSSTKSHKLAEMLRDEAASTLIVTADRQHRRAVAELPAESVPPLVVWVRGPGTKRPEARHRQWAALVQCGAEHPPAITCSPRALASIIYTSGTTGAPKGVVSLHADTVFATRSIARYLENTADDVIYCCLHLGFSYGLYQLLTSVAVGATLVLERSFAFPREQLALMAREGVTGFPGVPTLFSLLLELRDLAHVDLSSLRYVTNAAAPMPSKQVQAVVGAFPQARFFSMYGQTECKRACYLPPEDLARKPGSVGVAIPGTQVWVADEDGRPLAPGMVGELVVRGPHLMQGYWGRAEETAARLRRSPEGELLLHTGDLFRADDDGYLYFVSRMDDVIKCRGEKVSPHEIEQVLHHLDGVSDATAIGVPDPLLGEAVKVFVVRRPGASLTAGDVRAHCARHLDEVMVPSQVEFRAELPKSENGKTLRSSLRSCAA